MYPDPKRVRDNRVTIRLDDYEAELLYAMANYQGEQTSTLIRELAMAEAGRVLRLTGEKEGEQA